MATHKSADKRNRQNIKQRVANRMARGTIRSIVKKARAAAVAKDPSATEQVKSAERALNKAATKGLVHRNAAARSISRLWGLVQQKAN